MALKQTKNKQKIDINQAKMATKKVENVRMFVHNRNAVVSNLEIDIQDTRNKTVVLADNDDETPRDLDLVETSKFLAESSGDWELIVYVSYMKDFSSREEFDDWSMPKNLRKYRESENEISFEQALCKLGVDFSLNKNYYLDKRDEVENDLNRKLKDSENLTDKLPEKELLYKQLCILFGENSRSTSNNEYDYILEDFHYFRNMGADTATAKQGEYYLRFDYYSS